MVEGIEARSLRRPCRWWTLAACRLVPLAAVLPAAAPATPDDGDGAAESAAGAGLVLDGLCFDGQSRTREKCCGHPAHTGPCLWGGILSHGYCCDADPSCFAPGVLIEGSDVEEPWPARTGLECRHLCQAKPGCEAWTFLQADFPAEDLRFSCWLKSRHWSQAEAAAGRGREPGLVLSGSRHCPHNHTAVLESLRDMRTMTLDEEPQGCVVRPQTDATRYYTQAASCILRHGWVVLKGALEDTEAKHLGEACARAVQELLSLDPPRVGNRGPRRYSLGSASRTHHMVHLPEWVKLADVAAVTPVLRSALGEDYVAIGGGGDAVLEHTDSVQWLHVDLPRWEMYDRVHPPPGIGVNFAVHAIACGDGAMRLVPDTQTMPYRLEQMAPSSETSMLERHGLWRVFVCPLQRGDVLLRDLRLWHAGSANLGKLPRLSPNSEFLAQWYADATEGKEDHLAPRRVFPADAWSQMSPHAQHITSRTRATGPLDVGWVRTIATPQQYD